MIVKYLLVLSLTSSFYVWFVQARVQKLTDDYYHKINTYLADNVATNDITANMNKAVKWYSEVKSPLKGRVDKALVEALRKFIALSELEMANICNRESFEILTANDDATAGYVQVMRPNEIPDSRVDMIVHYFAVKHASQCHDTYPIELASRLKQLNPELVNRVDKFMGLVIRRSKYKVLHKDATASERMVSKYFADADPSIRGIDNARLAWRVLKFLAANDQDQMFSSTDQTDEVGKKPVNGKKIKEMFKKYFVDPCQYYVSQLGKDIFLPAKFDAHFFQQVDDSKADFYFAMGKFRLCQSLIDRDQNSLVEDLISVMKNE